MLQLGNDLLSKITDSEYESKYKLLTQPKNKDRLGIRLYKAVYKDKDINHVDFSWKDNVITLYKYCPEYQDGVITIAE